MGSKDTLSQKRNNDLTAMGMSCKGKVDVFLYISFKQFRSMVFYSKMHHGGLSRKNFSVFVD